MSGTFGKFLLPSLVASSAAFAVFAVPLVVYGSEKIDVRLSESMGITGAVVQDFTVPYLGLSGLASLSVGGVTATIVGVASSRKKAERAEKSYLEAQADFKNRERQLQDALLSESSLVKSGLSFFLDETLASPAQLSPTIAQVIVPSPVPVAPAPQPIQPRLLSAQPSVVQSFTVNSSNMGIQPVKVPRVTVQAATSPLNAAHGFLSFTRAGQVVTPAAIAWAEETAEYQTATQQIEVLQGQLQGLMVQIEALQTSLKTQAVADNTSRGEVSRWMASRSLNYPR